MRERVLEEHASPFGRSGGAIWYALRVGFRLRSFASAWACAALLSCGPNGPKSGTDVGNGATARVSINIKGYERVATSGTQSITTSAGVDIARIWMVVERMRLRPGSTCNES